MKFGKSAEEAEAEAVERGVGGAFMRYVKDGDTILRVLDEPDDWKYYWEHYNPDGYPYPCNSEDRANCPGCQSDNEKVSKASRKIAFNAWDGQYANIWKVSKTVADKLKMRYERLGTVRDRDYLLTRYKKDNGFYDYEVEGQEKIPFDDTSIEKQDPEDLLQKMWDDAWGDSPKVPAKKTASPQDTSKKAGKVVTASEPSPKYNEADLRKMDPWDLVSLCHKEGFGQPPKEVAETSDKLVDWMLTQ